MILDRVAQVLDAHWCDYISGTCLCGLPVANAADHANHVAAVLIFELDLRLEGRLLNDGSGGQSTNWKTGVTTSFSKPSTRQVRWVTDWVTDNEGLLPAMAYIPGRW